jgi:RNA ligase (TIGR02306 family)
MRDATVEVIESVRVHPDADKLDLCTILGYQCVTQKGLYQGGEKIVYIRPDSVLPQEEWTEEYRKYSPKRVKAVRLRGEWSEGIIVRFDLLPENLRSIVELCEPGTDVSEILEVVHYEPPTPQDLQAKGGLPFGIPKTDEDRFENRINKLPYGELVDETLKIDGQSCSFYVNLDVPLSEPLFGVLGRNLEIKPDTENNYTAHISRYDIQRKLTEYCVKHDVSLVLRGESFGQGIQSGEHNPHSKQEKGWAMFSVYIINQGNGDGTYSIVREYARKGHKHYFLNVAKELGLPHVPVINENVELTRELLEQYSTGIKKLMGKPFEGVVINHSAGSFKIINKHYDSLK